MKTSHGLAMDGFMRGSAAGGSTHQKSYKITEASNLLRPTAHIKSAAQGVHKGAQRSQTLMRSAVKKPTQAIAKTMMPSKVASPQPRTASVDQFRASRLQTIAQNNKVQRFGHVQAQTAPKSAAPQAVVPKKALVKSSAVQASHSVLYKPLPSMVTSVSHHKLERMLDEALTNADAHKKSLYKKSARAGFLQKLRFAPRWASVVVVLFAVVLLTGFLAMQKVPQVAMRVAATKAHINAHVPAYTPAGFSATMPIKYNNGSVSLQFKAAGNSSRSFTLTQKTSNMDSKSLSSSVVPSNTQVQTAAVDGTTVYIYDNHNDATWVNNGIQYSIKDSASLNSDQLLKIAGSL